MTYIADIAVSESMDQGGMVTKHINIKFGALVLTLQANQADLIHLAEALFSTRGEAHLPAEVFCPLLPQKGGRYAQVNGKTLNAREKLEP